MIRYKIFKKNLLSHLPQALVCDLPWAAARCWVACCCCQATLHEKKRKLNVIWVQHIINWNHPAKRGAACAVMHIPARYFHREFSDKAGIFCCHPLRPASLCPCQLLLFCRYITIAELRYRAENAACIPPPHPLSDGNSSGLRHCMLYIGTCA